MIACSELVMPCTFAFSTVTLMFIIMFIHYILFTVPG